MEEIWRYISGFNGEFMVSNLGRVKSTDRTILSRNRFSSFEKKVTGRFLKQHKRGKYYQVVITWHDKHYNYAVHRLVAFAFPEICGAYFDGAVVNHLDENPENNIAENLEWCSQSYNCNYGTRNSKISQKTKHPKTKRHNQQQTNP